MHPDHPRNIGDTSPTTIARFDDTGKISLDHIYTQPDPREYFTTLRKLEYCIPQVAKPYFTQLIREFQERRHRSPTVLDLGCSYGINAVLLRCDATMDELYRRYCPTGPRPSRETILRMDRELVRSRGRTSPRPRFIGLDASPGAITYAMAAGFLDDAVQADLEDRDPTGSERARLAGTDIVISTGCLGYISERTIGRVATTTGAGRPWMAHFVLRMFPFEPIADTLTALGYETIRLDQMFRQRRFASPEEQTLVLDTLSSVGVDPRGLETDGWLYAQLYVSRPRGTDRIGWRHLAGREPLRSLR